MSDPATFLKKIFSHSTMHPVYVCSFTNDRQANMERHIITRVPDEIKVFAGRYDVPGRAVYFGVNTIRRGENKRCKDNVAEICALYADIDFKDVAEDRGTILTRLKQLCLPPSTIVASGHGYHTMWLLKEAVDAQEHRDDVEAMLRKLAHVVAGDPQVAEIARVLRLPGTTNSKNGEAIPVTIERCDEGLRYELEDLRAWLDEERPVLTAKPRDPNGSCAQDDPFARLAREQICKAPVDIAQRLAGMTYHGPGERGIHATQLSVSAALAIQGKTEEEVVAILLPATRAAAGRAWEEEYWSERREVDEIRKCFRGWLKRLPEPAEAADDAEPEIADDGPPEPHRRPVILLRPDRLPTTLQAAQDALRAAGKPVFALDTVLVAPRRVKRPAAPVHGIKRKVETTRFLPLSAAQLQVWLVESAQFQKLDKRAKKYLPCDPPPAFVNALLDTPISWGFDNVIGLSSCPVMRADGSICAKSGYDPETQLYFALDPDLKMPAVPARPTREQATAALDFLLELLEEFYFDGATDKAVALAWLMLPALRAAMRVAPLTLFTANNFGSGKSYLVDLGAAIASGQDAAAVIGAGADNEETEKRLGALLLGGATHIAVDNVTFDIPGTSIWCHVSERPRLRLRVLGKSRAPEIDNAAYLTITGNNVQVKDDLVRRSLMCTMNVPVERPEKRVFKRKPVQMVLADRGKYLAAIFTIVRHYQANPDPAFANDTWESYDEFVQLVRNPLRHLDPELDPVNSVDSAREEDPTIVAIRELFDHWEKLWDGRETAGAYEVYEKATERDPQIETLRHPEFHNLFLQVCAGKYGKISSKSIGGWLKRIKNRVVDGKRLVVATDAGVKRGARYRLQDVARA